LAWIRTSIAVISFGFVVAKFKVWLRELALRLDPQMHPPENGASLPIGVAMMALGGLLAVLAAWRYHKVNLAIERGQVTADRGLVILVTIMISALAIIMIVYMPHHCRPTMTYCRPLILRPRKRSPARLSYRQ